MVKGSHNRNKQRIKVAKLHKHIQNQRNDYLHKLSKSIVDENQVICIEDLKVKDMMSDSKLARNISDVSWSILVSMLIYKANWYGRKVIKVPSTYPYNEIVEDREWEGSFILIRFSDIRIDVRKH